MNLGASPAGMSWSADRLETVTCCPYCKSVKYTQSVDDVLDFFFASGEGRFSFVRCCDCNALWLQQRPSAEHIGHAYAQYYTHGQSESKQTGGLEAVKQRLRQAYANCKFGRSTGAADRLGAWLYKQMAPDTRDTDFSYRFAPPAPAKILDYGCGGGGYLRMMRKLGYDVYGVDFDPVVVTGLKQSGITTLFPDEMADDCWTGEFEFITLGHVIEHVTQPTALLLRLSNMLRPGGTLYLEAPNAQATGLDIFGRYWRGLEAPRHFAIPSADSLAHAFKAAGLTVIDRHVPGFARKVIWEESMKVVPKSEAAGIANLQEQAPTETYESAEYLAVLARKD